MMLFVFLLFNECNFYLCQEVVSKLCVVRFIFFVKFRKGNNKLRSALIHTLSRGPLSTEYSSPFSCMKNTVLISRAFGNFPIIMLLIML